MPQMQLLSIRSSDIAFNHGRKRPALGKGKAF